MINYPDTDTRYQRMKESIQTNTDITDFRSGSTARAIVEIINEEIEDIYTRMSRYFYNTFLSTAQGRYLDLIGDQRCVRLPDETDSNYRYRISVTPLVEMNNNETALKLKCMEVEGVKDVIFVPYTYGTGSFSAFVITDQENASANILTSVQDILNKNKAFGIKGIATSPNIAYVNMTLNVHTKPGINRGEEVAIITNVAESVKEYIDNIDMGSTFSVNILINQIVNSNKDISHVEIQQMSIDSKNTFAQFYQCKWNEKLFAGTIDIL